MRGAPQGARATAMRSERRGTPTPASRASDRIENGDGNLRKSLARVLEKVRSTGTRPKGARKGVTSLLRGVGDVTGRTIYGDRPLRFRRLTVPDPDMPSITDPSAFDSAFKIRIAQLLNTRRDAKVLVERRYAGRGYQIPVVKHDPNLMSFLAYDEGQIVGTVSVRLDVKKRRVSAHDLYPDEIDRLCQDGWRICEFTQLAVDTAVASKPVLATLFHTAYLYASVVRGYSYLVIEVNPRHAPFYARALKFQPIGPVRTNKRVNAPAVLLGVPLATIADGVERYAGKPETEEGRGTLFRFGFPANEQEGVLNRLRDLVASSQKKL